MEKAFLNWNKEALFSIAGLLLAFVAILSEPFWTDIFAGLSPVNAFDWTAYGVFGVMFATTYFVFAPYLLFIFFLALAGFFGIRVIRNTETGERHGRWLAIFSATTSIFLLVVAALSVLSWF